MSAENTIDEILSNSGSFLILYWSYFHPFGKVVDKHDNIAVPFCRYWMRSGEIDSHSFPRGLPLSSVEVDLDAVDVVF